MINECPLITVITVVRNDVNNIENTINSVLSQDYNNLEYIIIDGASSDGTLEIIHSYSSRISKIVSEPDRGVYDGMNKGIAMSAGDWIIFMNSGDTFYDNQVLANFNFDVNELDTLHYGNFMGHYWDGSYCEYPKPFFNTIHKFKGMGICHQSMFFPGDLLRQERYDLSYKICADYALVYKMWKQGMKFKYTNVIVANYNWGNGISSNPYKRVPVFLETARACGQRWNPLFWAKLFLEYYRLGLRKLHLK